MKNNPWNRKQTFSTLPLGLKDGQLWQPTDNLQGYMNTGSLSPGIANKANSTNLPEGLVQKIDTWPGRSVILWNNVSFNSHSVANSSLEYKRNLSTIKFSFW